MFAVTPLMEPVERDEENRWDASIAIEIVVLCFIFNKNKNWQIKSLLMRGGHSA